MKKTLFFAAMSGLALVGCVENEPVTKGDGAPVPITFDQPVVSVPTRATEIYGNYPKDNTFAVYALYHDKTYSEYIGSTSPSWGTDPVIYMRNVTCEAHKTTNGGTTTVDDYWSPSTMTYYWPKNGYLTFAAYAPVMAETTNGGDGGAKAAADAGSTVYDKGTVKWDETGFTFTDFEVKETSKDQIDLLYSTRETDKTKNDELTSSNKAPYEGITLKFKHALSSILFTARTEGTYTGTTITLKSITVKNVINKGTFKQGYSNAAATSDSPEWTLGTATAEYSVPINEASTGAGMVLNATQTDVGGNVDMDNNGSLDTYPSDQNPPATPNGTNNVQNDGKRRSDLIVIPQVLNADGRKVTVEICYTLQAGADGKVIDQKATFQMSIKKQGTNNGDGGTTGGSTGGSTGGTTDGSTDNDAWEMGKRYIYHITIGLHEIRLNPQVYNWEDVTGDYQNVEIK